MPWNKPGSEGDNNNPNNNPWGNRGGNNQGPPDLDELVRQIKRKIDSLFGQRPPSNSDGSGNDGGNSSMGSGVSKTAGVLLFLVAAGIWLSLGVYTVDEGEQAVELRFGEYSQINDAGLHWHFPPPIERVEIVNTQNLNTVEVGYRQGSSNVQQDVPNEALMLTQDENIIDIKFAVQYDIKSARDLLFNVSEYNERNLANSVVRQATESAVREIVGRNTMDFAITGGRAELAAETRGLVQQILDRYQTGINIRSVEMQDAQPPVQVKDSFDDAVRAREDEERLKNLAQAYANDVVPRARGFAARTLQEAEAYKATVIAKAEGETSRFEQVLNEYSKAPQITRDRLYIETMESVFQNTSKVVVDQQDGGSNVMYLPLDQLIRNQGQSTNRNNNVSNQVSDPLTSNLSSFDAGVTRSSDRSVTRSSRQ